MSVTTLLLTTGVAYLIGAALIAFVLYLVVRRAVRDGMLDARAVDREEAVAGRTRQAQQPGPAAGSAPTPGPGPGA